MDDTTWNCKRNTVGQSYSLFQSCNLFLNNAGLAGSDLVYTTGLSVSSLFSLIRCLNSAFLIERTSFGGCGGGLCEEQVNVCLVKVEMMHLSSNSTLYIWSAWCFFNMSSDIWCFSGGNRRVTIYLNVFVGILYDICVQIMTTSFLSKQSFLYYRNYFMSQCKKQILTLCMFHNGSLHNRLSVVISKLWLLSK